MGDGKIDSVHQSDNGNTHYAPKINGKWIGNNLFLFFHEVVIVCQILIIDNDLYQTRISYGVFFGIRKNGPFLVACCQQLLKIRIR